MKCGDPPGGTVFPAPPGWLLLAAEQATKDVAQRTALIATEHAAQDAAQRVVRAATARAAEDAAQHVAQAATTAGRLRLGFGRGRCLALGQLLADVGQHDRREDREQLLEQV